MELKEQLINDTSQLPLIVYYRGNYEDISTETLISIIESNEKLALKKHSNNLGVNRTTMIMTVPCSSPSPTQTARSL